MAALGSFVLLTSSAGTGGGGGALPSLVTVPGNAAAIVARALASSALFTATETDANTVELEFPTLLTLDDVFTLSNQLNYVFGVLGEDELGWLTVTAKGILGLADTSDAGVAPDYVPVVGTVTLTPGLSRPIRIISTGQFLAVSSITATFDSDGELAFDGEKNIRLIAPQWDQLSSTTWRWTADVRPGPGQNWQAFTVNFTGLPGDVINLASLIS